MSLSSTSSGSSHGTSYSSESELQVVSNSSPDDIVSDTSTDTSSEEEETMYVKSQERKRVVQKTDKGSYCIFLFEFLSILLLGNNV